MTVTADDLVPTALGVNVTVKVHAALGASDDEQGVAPPGAAAKSPLPAITGLMEVERLLVRVTDWAGLAVATVCAAKVKAEGEKVRGRTDVPLTSSIC